MTRIKTQTRWFWIAACVCVCACEPGTGGQPIQFSLELGAEATAPQASPASFVTSTGWTVTLTEACIAVGPIYFFADPTHLQQEQAATTAVIPTMATRLWHLVLPTAHAHPGDAHFGGQDVRGEWLGQVALDVLRPGTLPQGSCNGLHGDLGSFSIWLDPPRTPLAGHPCLRGHHAWVTGVAEKNGDQIAFEGGLQIENVGNNRRVDGLPLAGTLTDATRVQVLARPTHWFDQADFAALSARAPSGRHLITPDSQVHRAWFIGIRAAGAFVGRVASAP